MNQRVGSSNLSGRRQHFQKLTLTSQHLARSLLLFRFWHFMLRSWNSAAVPC
jgi:hypothetical protein